MRSAKDLDTVTLLFQAVGLGKKPDKGVIPISITTYKAARKKVSMESWRKSTKGTPGASCYMVPSMYATYVEFNDNDKTVRIIARGDSSLKSAQGRLKLKASFHY
jgi:hypothetical protein